MRPHPPSPSEAAILIAVVLLGVALVTAAASVQPDPRGFGSHEQLGLPPCGFALATGLPCPTCGMTTSFAYFVRLRPVDAARANPVGAILFLVVVAAAVGSLFHLVIWRSPAPVLDRLPPVRLLLAGLVGLLLLGWGGMILRAAGGVP